MKKSDVQLITLILVLSTPIFWIAWDILAYLYAGDPATESATIFSYSTRYPAIALAWGFLTGHFFAQNRTPSTVALPSGFYTLEGKLILGTSTLKVWVQGITLLLMLLWLGLDVFFYPTLLTRLVSLIPGPGHGLLETVVFGTIVGFFMFQMDEATLAPAEK